MRNQQIVQGQILTVRLFCVASVARLTPKNLEFQKWSVSLILLQENEKV